MVVTDLHGDWATYLRLRKLFFQHRAQGEVDRLVLCGDVVHALPHIQPDRSYDILQDILMLRGLYGDDLITVLCGNHEMPHIYDLMFTRDNQHLPLNAALEQRISLHDRDGGQVTLGEQKLRFASGVYAKPVSQAVYLLLDAAEPVADMQALTSGLRLVWG